MPDNHPSRYRIKGLLGKANARVYEAEDPKGTRVALKVYAVLEDDLEYKRYFEREVSALSRIAPHPAVVSLFDSGYQSGTFESDIDTTSSVFGFFIAQELVRGVSLHEALSTHTLPEDQGGIIRLLIDISNGLSHIHKNDVLHRDLKPRNIVLRRDGGEVHPVIIDFGISKSPDAEGTTVAGALTPAWASPEQLTGGRITRASDIFSFGLIGISCLAGRELASNRHDSAESILREHELIADIPTAIHDIFSQCTDFSPEKRFASFSAISQALEKCLGDQAPDVYALVVRPGSINGYGGPPGGEIDLVEKDLNKGPTHIELTSQPQDKGAVYTLVGHQFEYKVSSDNRHPDRALFVIVGRRFDRGRMRAQRLAMLSIAAEWEAYKRSDSVPESRDIGGLLEYVRDYSLEINARNRRVGELRHKIKLWKEFLAIEAANIKEAPDALGYQFTSHFEPSPELVVCQGPELQKAEFSPEQFIAFRRPDGGVSPAGKVVNLNKKDGSIAFAPHPDLEVKKTQTPGKLCLDVSAELQPVIRAQRALNQVQSLECPKRLEMLLAAPDGVMSQACSLGDLRDRDLSPSKKAALSKALGASSALLLQGPPGTGKTRFLVALIREILARSPSSRILVSSQANVALDNALESLAKTGDDIGIVRIGDFSRVSPSIHFLHIDTQVDKWLESIKTNVRGFLEDRQQSLATTGEVGELYAKIKKIKSILLDEKNWQQELVSAEAQAASAYSRLSKVTKKWKEDLLKDLENVDPEDLPKLVQLQQNRLEELKSESDLSEKLATLNHERAEITSIVSELANQRVLIKRELEDRLQVQSLEDETINSQLDMLEGKISEAARTESERIVLLDEWMRKLSIREPSLIDSLLAYGVSVTGATCVGAGRQLLEHRHFDWVIIDEAARANPGELMIPMLRGDKYVLVGDQQQLPPFVALETRNDLLKKLGAEHGQDFVMHHLESSLFGALIKLIHSSSREVLKEQFRMTQPLGDMVSQIFYQGKLDNSHAPEPQKKLFCGTHPILWISTSSAQDRREQALRPGFTNTTEAKLVARLVSDKFKNSGDEKRTIAILAPYRGQVRALTDALSGFTDLVEVSTIDNYQGREADFVIYSCVRSNSQKRLGFLQDVRRLTVALSRARHQLVLVGDLEMLRSAEFRNDQPNVFWQLANYMENHPKTCSIVNARDIENVAT